MRRFVRKFRIKIRLRGKLRLLSQGFRGCIIVRRYLKWKLDGEKHRRKVKRYLKMLQKLKNKSED